MKKKYEVKVALADAMKRCAKAGKVDDFLSPPWTRCWKLPGISAEDTQQALFLKSQVCLTQNNKKEGLAFMKKALDAAPQSELAPMLKQRIAQLDHPQKGDSKTEE